MALVQLFKEQNQYTDKDGNEKTATNFSILCGDVKIPIEVKYFENKELGRDPAYSGRKLVLSSYAEEIPAKEKQESIDT